eukprot:TRINITY_DN823_c0_g1_i7.p1 TRINITY_DN823_c0_g1~~TRINITY_DN823_c0_g1_i7.p1  ORF type:complete len:230 (+),score=30.70 TRINITY_DN823_c0_g1_i7:681-1370(+)
MKILQDSGNSQIVYYQHKTLSAASAKKDLVVQRTYREESNGYTFYAYSIQTQLAPVTPQFGRANLLFHKCTVTESSPGKVDVRFVWCFDFNGWLHVKFIEAEKTKVALRMTRMIKNIPHSSLGKKVTAPIAKPSQPNPASSSYAQFNAAMRAASGDSSTTPITTTYEKNLTAPTETPSTQYCNHCRMSVMGNFCSRCGNKTEQSPSPICPSCHAPSSGNFCSSCGHKLK